MLRGPDLNRRPPGYLPAGRQVSQTKLPISISISILLRGPDLNRRPPGYEPDELPNCSTPRYFFKTKYLSNTITVFDNCQTSLVYFLFYIIHQTVHRLQHCDSKKTDRYPHHQHNHRLHNRRNVFCKLIYFLFVKLGHF